MIEIKAKLVRADSAIFAVGENVECFIELTHKQLEDIDQAGDLRYNGDVFFKFANFESFIHSEHVENLAWASVQLHCYRKTSYSLTQDKPTDLADMIGRTALDAVTLSPGDIIVATKPKILFCDLKLKYGESKTYFFSDFVPRDGPPTYRGHEIKYFYKITIAMQRVKSKVQTLTVPIRVLPIPIIVRLDEMPGTEETNEELTPTNPFLEKRELTELEISWHHLKNVTARRAPKFYRISNKRGFVGRFCLFKPAYKLGEDIVGSLDFVNCKVRCVQFSVKLQSQEISLLNAATNQPAGDFNDTSSIHSMDLASIASGNAVDNLHKSTTSGSAKSNADVELPTGKITTYATCHKVCYAMLQTQVVIPISLHATPSFRTDLVDVRWRLHFEFVTSTLMDFGTENPTEGELRAPPEIPVETMIWNLPLTIYSANPLQIYSPSQSYSMLIK